MVLTSKKPYLNIFKMDKIQIKKQIKIERNEDFKSYTKEELITKIKVLQAHNTQLKNIIAKTKKPVASKKDFTSFDFSTCRFRPILLKLFYLGWDYQGFATQEDTSETIENHLFYALTKTCLIEDRTSSNYHRCGRTDKGVSSFGQTISIKVRSKLTKENENNLKDEINYCKVLNKVLPDGIQCVAWSPVHETFSARFDCKSRTYKYFFPKGNLDITKMQTAGNFLLGTHDFRNFCKMDVGNGVVQFIRNILDLSIQPISRENNEDGFSMYVLTIQGKAFLWHQIRCVVAILFLIGENKEDPSLITNLLDVEKTPRKPLYDMVSEVPLNLYFCDYGDIKWYYDEDSLRAVIQKLNKLWTFTAVKETMVKEMLTSLNTELAANDNKPETNNKTCLNECLVQGVKRKKYTPVIKRQTCESLEDKIRHFTKRNRIKFVNNE